MYDIWSCNELTKPTGMNSDLALPLYSPCFEFLGFASTIGTCPSMPIGTDGWLVPLGVPMITGGCTMPIYKWGTIYEVITHLSDLIVNIGTCR